MKDKTGQGEGITSLYKAGRGDRYLKGSIKTGQGGEVACWRGAGEKLLVVVMSFSSRTRANLIELMSHLAYGA